MKPQPVTKQVGFQDREIALNGLTEDFLISKYKKT